MPRVKAAVGALMSSRAAIEAPSSAAGVLPLSHRFSLLYVAAPVVIWILGWFKWWVGIPIAILLIAGLWKVLAGSWRISLSLPVLVSFVIALAWILVYPVSGLWQPAGEIMANYNLILDLGRGEWPTYLTDYLNDDPPLLGFYLGWHIVPGLIGKWLGPTALSWAIPLWTWIGVGLMVVIFTRGLPTLRTTLIAALILVFFSGLDVLDHVLSQGPAGTLELMLDRLNDNRQLALDETTPLYLKYQSNSETLWWSPHHLIASGLVSLIILQSRHQRRLAAVSGLAIVICAFWSVLAAAGLIPLVIAFIIKNGLRPFLKWPNLIAAPLLAALMALYLINTHSSLHFGWLWNYYTSNAQMIIDIMTFYLTEFLLLIILLWMMDRRIAKEPFFVASIAVLFILPWYVYGNWQFNNDALLRVSIPALVVLNYYTAHAVISRLPEMASNRIYSASKAPRRLYASLIAMLAVGTITVLFIFLRSGNRPSAAYAQTANTSLISTTSGIIDDRIINTTPGLLQSILRDHSHKGLKPGEQIVNSRYDIYHQDQAGMLVYLNRNCIPELERSTRFYLHIYPVTTHDLPPTRKQTGYDTQETRWESTYKNETNCIGLFNLPNYEMTHVIIGQYYPYLGYSYWKVEYPFDNNNTPSVVEQTNEIDPARIYQSYHLYRQLVAAEEPEIRSTFNVHLVALHQNMLFYTKDPCTSQDTQPNFFLHITPVDINNLPPARQLNGFDNYDFQFEERGVIFDDRCLAIIQIPDYKIANINTGQFDPAQDRILWQGEITTRNTDPK